MAISIPITLAMTFGFIYVLGIDIQQVSVASLIIALGLLVDDPVVAGDSIKRMLAEGQPRIVAPWLGPTKIATAIMFATITNIVAYLPFLMITGTTGEFIYSLPIVMTCRPGCLAAGVDDVHPAAGLLPAAPRQEAGSRRSRSAAPRASPASMRESPSSPSSIAGRSPSARWLFWCWAAFLFTQLKTSFFPDDVQYWSYVDVWLPNDANFDATNQAAQQVEQIIREQADVWGKQHPEKDGSRRTSCSTSPPGSAAAARASGSRLSPQPKQLNYAQVLVQLNEQGHHARLRRPGAAGPVRHDCPACAATSASCRPIPINYPVEIRVVSQADVGTAQQRPGHRRDAAHRLAGDRHRAARRRKPCACATSGRRKASRSA